MLYQEVLVFQVQEHDIFQEWRKAGVFKRTWIDGLSVYDKKTGIDLETAGYCMLSSQKRLLGKKAQDQIPQTELV